ncbi:MAG: GNAT family N-acetyltransferase [Deltaproteobacteria bacterium]|nr:GNAT family N-acetyltransferase [Deltaproteobacteria bacterium]
MHHELPPCSLRRAVAADAPAIAAVHVEGWRWGYRGLLPADELAAQDVVRRTGQWHEWLVPGAAQLVWVAEHRGAVVGFVAAGPARDVGLPATCGEVLALYLAERAAGSGAGRELLRTAEAGLLQTGFDQAILWVLGSNRRARDFYRRQGWQPDGALHREGGRCGGQEQVRYAKVLGGDGDDDADRMVACLTAYASGRPDLALAHAEHAAAEDDADLLAACAVQYLRALDNRDAAGVYLQPAGFVAFVEGGGKPAHYRATSARLAASYRQLHGARVCDLGSGDGRALRPALAGANVHLTAVEPSPALFAQLQTALAAAPLGPAGQAAALQATAQQFLGLLDPAGQPGAPPWDLVHATFALQSLPPGERAGVLATLARRTRRLVLVEFAVPDWALPAERAAYCARHYRRGLAEYAGNDQQFQLVAQGFLMPVLFGAFDPDRPAANYEQSAARWQAELTAAGFVAVTTTALWDYWWAPAVWIEAIGCGREAS